MRSTDAETLRKYLLGELRAEDREALEFWILTVQDAYDLVAASEDDLIDDSLAGSLEPDERDRFDKHYLAAPERRHKLQFGHTFRQFLERPNLRTH